MLKFQAGFLAVALLLSLSACSMRDDWVDDASYAGEQRRAQQQKEKERQDAEKARASQPENR